MTDEEYLFKQTERERKRIGRGDYNKKRQGGRYVRLPSDSLSKKEKEERNGMVTSYNMNKPVKWSEFRKWPADIQKEYLEGITAKYGIRSKRIIEMLGCSINTYYRMCDRIGFHTKRGGRTDVDERGWREFLGEETPVKLTVDEAMFERDKTNVANLIASLIGTGAELTIKLVL